MAIKPLVFLDNAASTQRPRQVIDAISGVYERDYANVHRGIHTLSELSTEQYEAARSKVQRFHQRRQLQRSHLHAGHDRRDQHASPAVGAMRTCAPATKCCSR